MIMIPTEYTKTFNDAAPTSWAPAGCTGQAFSMTGPSEGTLWLTFDDGTMREASDDELFRELLERPTIIRHVDPDRLRRMFGDLDGELFGLFADLHRARRQAAKSVEGGVPKEAKIIEGLASLRASTSQGAILQLALLQSGQWNCERLSEDQQRRLLSSGSAALWRAIKREAG